MKCNDVATSNTEHVSVEDTIENAAKRMAELGIGFFPICDADRKVVGVVTDRDIVVRAVAGGRELRSTKVTEIMSHPALTCRVDGDLRLAEEIMEQELTERVVLTNPDGTLAGVLTIADIIERAPRRQALRTLKAVLWREAVGPRTGADIGQKMLKSEQPEAKIAEADLPHTRQSVFEGGQHDRGITEFP